MFYTLQQTFPAPAMKTNQLILQRQIIAVCSEKKNTYTKFFGRTMEFFFYFDIDAA
jgi:hypothetical protein